MIPTDPRYLPHPSQSPDPLDPKSICPLCHAANNKAIHALEYNRKRGFWWPEGARTDGSEDAGALTFERNWAARNDGSTDD